MSKKKKTMLALAIILGIAVVGLAAGVYAKYFSSLTSGNGSLTVAKWAFEDDNDGTDGGKVTCNLGKTYKASTLVAGKIAPGTEGTCTIKISNENSEVGVTYTLTPTGNMDGPTNLVFKENGSAFTTKTGTLAPGGSETVTIDWVWPYETPENSDDGDSDDTADGEAASSSMTAEFTITGTQVKPEV